MSDTIHTNFKVPVGRELLDGILVQKENHVIANYCVYLHGAGLAVKETALGVFSEPFVQRSYAWMAIDFSGHGRSTGILNKGSLAKRVTEACTAIEQVGCVQPLTVCGTSMGGYVALKLLERYDIATLILFCPAVYDSAAYHIPFDQGFTEIIRTPESWRSTDIIPLLERFTGKLLIVIGQEDEVIPPGVIDLLMRHSPRARTKELYRIPGCPHKIHHWIADKTEELRKLHDKISEYM